MEINLLDMKNGRHTRYGYIRMTYEDEDLSHIFQNRQRQGWHYSLSFKIKNQICIMFHLAWARLGYMPYVISRDGLLLTKNCKILT